MERDKVKNINKTQIFLKAFIQFQYRQSLTFFLVKQAKLSKNIKEFYFDKNLYWESPILLRFELPPSPRGFTPKTPRKYIKKLI